MSIVVVIGTGCPLRVPGAKRSTEQPICNDDESALSALDLP